MLLLFAVLFFALLQQPIIHLPPLFVLLQPLLVPANTKTFAVKKAKSANL
jgi:hypothetical protein